MKEHSRAMVAAVAFAAVTGRKVSSIYSYTASGFRNVEVQIAGGQVRGYDFVRNAHIEGPLNNIYDFGDSAFVEMSLSANKANGYHFGSSDFYEAAVNGNEVEVYDYGASGFFTYSVTT